MNNKEFLLALSELGLSNDDVARLPHPLRQVRVQEALEADTSTPIFDQYCGPGTSAVIEQMLRRPDASVDHCVAMLSNSTDPRLVAYRGLLMKIAESGASDTLTPVSTIHNQLVTNRFVMAGGRLFEVTKALNDRLLNTDISTDVPVCMLRAPYPVSFFHFGHDRDCPITLWHPKSGDHVFDGCYISETSSNDGRVLDIVFTGSPVGKQNCFDDVYSCSRLKIPHALENNPVSDLIDQMLSSRYVNEEESDPLWSSRKGPEDAACALHILKTLLYLSSDRALQEANNRRTDMEHRINSLGTKKAAKAKRKLGRLYDCVTIGPSDAIDANAQPNDPSGYVAMHWRRGHFRNQMYGPENSLRKLIWIEPVLVAPETGAGPAPKKYKIR